MVDLPLTGAGQEYSSRAAAMDEPKSQRLRARGAVLCANTEDLIVRSQRAIDRSRGLLGGSYKIVGRQPRA